MSTICEVTPSNVIGDWAEMVGQEEVGLYTQRVKIAWPCLGFGVKILQQEWMSYLFSYLSTNRFRKQSPYLVGPPSSVQGRLLATSQLALPEQFNHRCI